MQLGGCSAPAWSCLPLLIGNSSGAIQAYPRSLTTPRTPSSTSYPNPTYIQNSTYCVFSSLRVLATLDLGPSAYSSDKFLSITYAVFPFDSCGQWSIRRLPRGSLAAVAQYAYASDTSPKMSDLKSDADGSPDPPGGKPFGSSMDGAPYWTPAEVEMSKTKLAANDTYRQALLYFSATHSPALHQNFQGPPVLAGHVDPY